jgi:hypothetical protein
MTYHPDPAIDAEVRADGLLAERADLAAGYGPRWWRCPCGASHRRGWFMSEGVHRCLRCGYVGEGGTIHTNQPSDTAGEDAS